MKISIVTAAFNNVDTIAHCIQSLQNQTFKEVEHVIIDGGSTDGTLDILEQYKDQIVYISEPDKGIYDALNKGLKLASGQVIGTLGADDFYPNNDILEAVWQKFEETGAEAVYGDKNFVNPENIEKEVRHWVSGEYKIENWLKGWMPPHLSFYLRKVNFEKYGPYITDFRSSGDYELMLRMLYKHQLKTAYLPKLVVTMRTGGTSTASLKHRIRANKEDRRAWAVNNLKPKWYTLWMKPISKISQFF
ncbi:glycosyltransferase [Marinilongibacter aquaticus]|uniref:glycosyltransferase family 2 protein n=1 Tax=Marinilongibacter aquaticus TaxID=2975157 RepID=UPI0021BD07D3|nr:glycosyltransferase family 2 protein [Marinilongibacter aquaticus]UBM57897.1 glycosyltransferase [Marinilongibacter aquaticus]